MSLINGDGFVPRSYNKNSIGKSLHVFDTAVKILKPDHFTLQRKDFLLSGTFVERTRFLLKKLQPLDTLSDGRKVSQGTTKPSFYHVEHSAFIRFLLNDIFGILFGPDKKNFTTISNIVSKKINSFGQPFKSFFKIDDMDTVPLHEDIWFVVGMPPASEVSEVCSGTQQVIKSNFQTVSLSLGELEGASSTAETIFLPLFFTGITGEETCLF